MKSICYRLLALFFALTSFTAYSGSGLLFDVTASGAPARLSLVLCLNGKAQISCQNYSVSRSTLAIKTTIPNHVYPSVGIRILTPGYTVQNCTPAPNGYCLFAANDTVASQVAVEETVSTSYSVGGTTSGLSGTVVLQNNGGDNLSVSADGSFTFTTPQTQGSAYNVTVLTQPATQTCTVSNGSGIVGAGNVTSVTVNCTNNTYTVGGTVSGLSGTVVLQNNGGDNLSISANGSFTFPTALATGAPYNVTILTQPGGLMCTVSSGSGTIGSANVTNVSVICSANSYTVGGSVSGLVGTVVLQNNSGDNLSINANGGFTFATAVAEGAPYNVTVLTQPATQTCIVTNGNGTMGSANVTNVVVTCTTNTYTVGGTVSGLVGTVVLQNNGGDNLSVNANGNFTFATAVAQGSPYSVTVFTQPATQTCIVTNGSGTMGAANVTNVQVVCTTNTYSIGGTLSGLIGTVVLQNNGGDNLTLGSDGAFAFSTQLPQGATYAVTVLTQPAGQFCTVNNGSGTVGAANVTNIMVTCAQNSYTIGGTLSGLPGGESVVLQNNGGNNLTLNANGAFTFTTPVAQGGTYAVTVLTQPTTAMCSVSSGSGTVGSSNVTSVVVTCSANSFTVGGNLTGLAGGETVVLQNNGGNNLSRSADGAFTFTTPVAQGSPYAVTVLTQPTTQTCSVTNGTGTMGGANVTNVAVNCVSDTTTLSVDATGTIPVPAGTGTLTVTNTGANTAHNVAAVLPSGWTSVTQDASDCVTVLSGATCTLSFTAADAYVAQGGIVVTGDNISTPPTTALAFTVSGALVFAVDGVGDVRAVDPVDLGTGVWGGFGIAVGPSAQSFTDGNSNTIAIEVAIGPSSAASRCRQDGGAYLPAICELGNDFFACGSFNIPNIYENLEVLGFGNLAGNAYWSSTEDTILSADQAWGQDTGTQIRYSKADTLNIRCVRNLAY